MGMHRIWKDSKGHKAEVVLFSEFRVSGYDHPSPEDIVFSMFGRTPGMVEADGGSRYHHDSRKKYVNALRLALSILPERQRNIIYLKYYDGLNTHEVGRCLGISHQAVSQSLILAVKNLRDFLVKGNAVRLRNAGHKVDKTANRGKKKIKTGVRKMETTH
jgi:DNA-directed RNA polymerase specialized sigma24 family protein